MDEDASLRPHRNPQKRECKGTVSRSFRATFPFLVIRFGLALRLSLQLSTCLRFTIRVLLADVRDLSTKLSVGVHGRS